MGVFLFIPRPPLCSHRKLNCKNSLPSPNFPLSLISPQARSRTSSQEDHDTCYDQCVACSFTLLNVRANGTHFDLLSVIPIWMACSISVILYNSEWCLLVLRRMTVVEWLPTCI